MIVEAFNLLEDTPACFVFQPFIIVLGMNVGVERERRARPQTELGWSWHAKRAGVTPSILLVAVSKSLGIDFLLILIVFYSVYNI